MHRSVLAVVIIFMMLAHDIVDVLSDYHFILGWLVLVVVQEFALVRGMYIEHMIVVVLRGVSYLNYLDRLVLLCFRDSEGRVESNPRNNSECVCE